jgi:hypothetical protein
METLLWGRLALLAALVGLVALFAWTAWHERPERTAVAARRRKARHDG